MSNIVDDMDQAAELKAMTRLHELSMRLLATTELQPILEEVLDATIALFNADLGNVQLYNSKTKALEIIAQRGFGQDFLDHFSSVSEDTAVCGRALHRGERIIIEDVLIDPDFAPHRAIAASAGFRAVQSTPIFSRSGRPLGMFSTHFRQPHRPLDRDLRMADLYARLAADLIERQQAEQSLRAADQRAEMILDSITDRFFSFDKEWRFTYFNQHAREYLEALGRDPDSLIGKVYFEEFPVRYAEAAVRRAMSERVAVIHEFYFPPLQQWVEGRIYPSPDGGIGVYQRDISERKRAEENLRRSEAYLAEGQRLSHTGSWAWNVFTGEVYWSAEMFRIYGLNPEQVTPGYPDVLNYIHPDDRARVQKTFEDAVRGEREYELTYRVIWADGTIRHVNNLAHPVFSGTGDLIEYVGTTIDTTERIQAEENLRRSEAHLAAAQKIGHVGSWIWNVTTGDCFWSQEHFRIFGLDPETFNPTKENTQRLIHPRDLPFVEETLERAVRERGSFEIDYRMIRPDGSMRYQRGIGHPVNGDHRDVEFIGMVVDVTERKQAEEALLKAQAQLAHVMRVTTLGELTASIAHEVNQPLGAIVTNCQASLRLLSRTNPDLSGAREALESIIGDSIRASEVIKRIRSLLKKSMPETIAFNVNEAIRNVLDLTRSELSQSEVHLQTDLANDLAPVVGDRVQLEQVVLNLILNSKEAMSQTGWHPRDLLIKSEQNGPEEVLVTVRDTGVGVDPEKRDRVFDPFFTSKEGGLGLGLSISRTIIKGQGGKLWTNPNRSGLGATFQFSLPTSGAFESETHFNVASSVT